MATPYKVEVGEHLASIAARNGVVDVLALHNAPDNAAFKALRPDPGVLAEGDELFLPDIAATKEVVCGPGSDNEFVFNVPVIKLRLKFVDESGEPRVGLRATLHLGETPSFPETDDAGMLEFELPATFETFDCPFDGGELELKIGDLSPVSKTRGMLTRLQHLGYLPTPLPKVEAVLTYAIRLAVEEFQCDHGLVAKPKLDDAGRARLLEVHGA